MSAVKLYTMSIPHTVKGRPPVLSSWVTADKDKIEQDLKKAYKRGFKPLGCKVVEVKLQVVQPPPKYVGLTYSSRHNPKKWSKAKCNRGEHLLDECVGAGGHTLSCDACHLVVRIAEIIKPGTPRYREYIKEAVYGD